MGFEYVLLGREFLFLYSRLSASDPIVVRADDVAFDGSLDETCSTELLVEVSPDGEKIVRVGERPDCRWIENYVGESAAEGRFLLGDRETGKPFSGAKDCIVKGLTKAFGIGLNPNGLGLTGQNEHCPRCFERDRKMATILAHNNRCGRPPISARQMVRASAGTACER